MRQAAPGAPRLSRGPAATAARRSTPAAPLGTAQASQPKPSAPRAAPSPRARRAQPPAPDPASANSASSHTRTAACSRFSKCHSSQAIRSSNVRPVSAPAPPAAFAPTRHSSSPTSGAYPRAPMPAVARGQAPQPRRVRGSCHTKVTSARSAARRTLGVLSASCSKRRAAAAPLRIDETEPLRGGHSHPARRSRQRRPFNPVQ